MDMELAAKRFAEMFRGRESAYGTMSLDAEGKKRVKTHAAPVPDGAYLRHLQGDGPFLGIVPIDESNRCYFGAIDVDDDGVDLHELEAKIVGLGLPLVVCRSKSGGAHLYCFVLHPVAAKIMQGALQRMRGLLGHEKNANGMPVEVFPKQTTLAPHEQGNWINLPYYDHLSTNRYAVTGGKILVLDDFFQLVTIRTTDEATLLQWVDPSFGPFADGPICLQTLHTSNGFAQGGRNTGLFNVGLFFKLSQPESWADALREYNTIHLNEPLPAQELEQMIAGLEKREYAYTCSQHPLEGACKKAPCRKQPFGIGYFAKKFKLSKMPGLANLVRVNTEPARWRLDISGRTVEVDTETLNSPTRFKNLCLEKASIVIPMLKQQEWDDLVTNLLETLQTEEAPAEASDKGLLLTYLSDFLRPRDKSQSIEDVMLGRPARDDDGRVYFRAPDFYEFLKQRRFARFNTNEIYTLLERNAGLGQSTRTIKGARVSLFHVPEPTDEQSEVFAYPSDRTGGAPY
jgi:hypothetical protein